MKHEHPPELRRDLEVFADLGAATAAVRHRGEVREGGHQPLSRRMDARVAVAVEVRPICGRTQIQLFSDSRRKIRVGQRAAENRSRTLLARLVADDLDALGVAGRHPGPVRDPLHDRPEFRRLVVVQPRERVRAPIVARP